MLTTSDFPSSEEILSPNFLAKYIGKHPNWGFNGLGYVVAKRTYMRLLELEGRTEEWWETVERCVRGAQKIGACYTTEEAERLYDHVFNLRCNFAGRSLWQLNTSTVDRFGANSLINCFFTIISCVEDFNFVFENLMLGSGVGGSVRREHVHEFAKVKKDVCITHKATKDADFIVPDSREGWVELLRKVLNAYFTTGRSFSYSTILIRGYGEKIGGFGGTASGPQILIDGIANICSILEKRAGKKIRSVDALDVFNIIASIVVAGNVRRSSEIALGDADDILFLRAKRWDLGNIPNWRAMSNNTIVADSFDYTSPEFWNGYNGNGEPYGLFNLELSKTQGRLGEFVNDNCEGTNPCSEISLADGEACNLSELYLNNISSPEELLDCAKLLYKTQKAICAMTYLHEKTNKIIHKNMRIGIGVTGICQSLDKIDWLDKTYVKLREYDKEWSKKRGWNPSIKISTIKPSGCSRKDSLVITDKGILRLDEIGNVNGEKWQSVQGLIANTDKTSESITKFYINGKVKTKKITTKDGIELESSLNHRYRVVSNGKYLWKYVSDLDIGDCLVSTLNNYLNENPLPLEKISLENNTNNQVINQPEYLTDDLAWLLGLFYGDGSVHDKGIRISFNRKDNDLIVKIKEIIQKEFGIVCSVDNDHSIYCSSQQLKKWLEFHGCMKNYCEYLSIPKIIRQGTRSNIQHFIHGFWRADGGTHNASNSWSLCTVAKQFAQELAILCRAVGFNVKIKNAGPGGLGDKDRYLISIRHLKEENLRYVRKSLKERMYNGFWLDPITSIKDSECDTYDIEVKKEHCYILNSYVSHNTLSLLAGATPGVHPAYDRYYIRRVRMSSLDPLIETCKRLGYTTEFVKNFDGTFDHKTTVVEFPCECTNALLAKDVTAIQQLELVKKIQTVWADNAVSVTVYYKPEELPEIKDWLKDNYETSIKAVSFLRHQEHGFQQAPYESITEEVYRKRISQVKPLSEIVNDTGGNLIEASDCQGGACPVR